MRVKTTTPKAVITLLLLELALPLLAWGQQAVDIQTYPSPGKLVDVGGYRLHLNCIGKGSPTVVMEGGAGDFSLDWSLVQPSVAKFTRVCSYDRAGYGWSDPGPMPRTMRQIVSELHAGLKKAGVKGPIVFVGQSLGGVLARLYAVQYPKDVAGVVLVDSTHEDTEIMLNNKLSLLRGLSRGREIPPVQSSMPASTGPSSSGEAQKPVAGQSKLAAPYNKLPADIQQMRLWATSQAKYGEARRSEFDFLGEELAQMHAERTKREYPLGDMPLIVLTRGKDKREGHTRLQTDLVRLSRNSKQVIAQNSGHHIQLDEPEFVADAVRQVVEAVRRNRRLVSTKHH